MSVSFRINQGPCVLLLLTGPWWFFGSVNYRWKHHLRIWQRVFTNWPFTGKWESDYNYWCSIQCIVWKAHSDPRLLIKKQFSITFWLIFDLHWYLQMIYYYHWNVIFCLPTWFFLFSYNFEYYRYTSNPLKVTHRNDLPLHNHYVICNAISSFIIHLSFCTSQIWWTKISWISSRSGNTARCISCYHPTCWWLTPLLLNSWTVSVLLDVLISVSSTTLHLGHHVEGLKD